MRKIAIFLIFINNTNKLLVNLLLLIIYITPLNVRQLLFRQKIYVLKNQFQSKLSQIIEFDFFHALFDFSYCCEEATSKMLKSSGKTDIELRNIKGYFLFFKLVRVNDLYLRQFAKRGALFNKASC